MRTKVAIILMTVSAAAFSQQAPTDATIESLVAAGVEAARLAADGFDALDPATLEMLAPVVAAWISDTRDAARARGVHGIPAEIREQLDGYVPEPVLDAVRWRIDDSTVSVQRSLFELGYTPAVTVGDVILFANADEAAKAWLWAHELVHVGQYRDWGVDGFVARYLADHAAVEHEASEFAWQWMKATGNLPPP